MPRPPQITELAALRTRRQQDRTALSSAITEVERARRQRDRLIAGAADDQAIAAARQACDEAGRRYQASRASRQQTLVSISALSQAAARAEDDEQSAALFASLEGEFPILMMPVRLETRYLRDALGRPDLLVRLYPDAVQVSRHLGALTEAELLAGQAYWRARFDRPVQGPEAGAEPAERQREQRAQALWADLVRTLRAPRAAYVVNRTRPLNAGLLEAEPAAPVEPDFGPAPATASRLAAQPTALALPERYGVIGLARGGQVVFRRFGAPVPRELAMAPIIEPGEAPPPGQAPDPFDGEAGWLARLEPALAQGMAVRITQADVDAYRARHAGTPVFSLNDELERLVVIGVDWTLTPDEAATEIAELFEGQAASAGIGFIPVGTPTNNTTAGSSGHSPSLLRDPAAAQPTPPAPGTSAVETLRFALGLPEHSFTQVNLPGAELDDGALGGHMANALYAGTIGSYLHEMWSDPAGPHRLDAGTLESLREHVVSCLRPAGPLQPLRIDTQPYGVLPVVAAGRFVGQDAFESGLAQVLGLLRPSWRLALEQVPRFDGQVPTTHALLQQGPWAQAVSYRRIEREPVASSAQLLLARFQQSQRQLPGGLFMQLMSAAWGAQTVSSVSMASLAQATTMMEAETSRLPAAMPWVMADPEVRTREADAATPAPAYLGEIAQAIDRGVDLKGRFAQMRQAGSLLQGLLAWSVDREADAGNLSLVTQVSQAVLAGQAQSLMKTPRALGIEAAAPVEAGLEIEDSGQLAALRLPSRTGDDTIGTHVARQASAAHHAARAEGLKVEYAAWHQSHRREALDDWKLKLRLPGRHLASVRSSLDELGGRTVGELNWALRTTLDAFDHRLDAWCTSLATRRLARLRAGSDGQRRTGLHVGAFGWVERLRPDPVGRRESRGHLLAPSLRHAAAAAVLRSGYDNGDARERQALALDLSSHRVRAARDLFEGLAQGQPLAVLLGYRFERGLRDAALGQYILTGRQTFPLRPAGLRADGTPEAVSEVIATRDVVDGVKLLSLTAGQLADALATAHAAAGLAVAAPDLDRLRALHGELSELWDAVADVSIAESVHQLAQGNMERAAAALATLDKQTQPVEPQSVLSPRDGISYTQRVVLLLDPGAPAPEGWPVDEMAQAEPWVNAWLAELIGAPGRWRMRASAQVEGELQPLSIEVRVDGLGASPLALMMAVNAPGTGSGADQVGPAEGSAGGIQGLSRLRLMVVEALRATLGQRFPGRPASLVIEEQRPGESGLLHLEALLALAQRLLVQSRPATRRDLAVIEPRFDRGSSDGDFPGVQADELFARADAARRAMAQVQTRLDAAVTQADLAQVRALLARCRPYGVLGAEAEHRPDRDGAARDEADRARAVAALADLEARQRRIDGLLAGVDASLAASTAVAIDVLKTIFGKAFPVVPLFSMGPAAPVVQASLAAQGTLTAGRPAAVAGWLPKISKVRDGVERLQSVLLAHEALVGALPSRRFVVLQSTARPTPTAPWQQAWMALPEAWPAGPQAALLGTAHQRPDLAVALLRPDGLVSVHEDTLLAGLVCDDWAETVPLHTSTAAIAFHFDAPGARPPQSLLLAVPPQVGMAAWSFEAVLDTVLEAAELARLRAVQPAQLAGAVNLALPMNAISDSVRADTAGFDIKWLADEALRATAAVTAGSVFAKGKV